MKRLIQVILFIGATFALISCESNNSSSLSRNPSSYVKISEIYLPVSDFPTQGTKKSNPNLSVQEENQLSPHLEDSYSINAQTEIPSTSSLTYDIDMSTPNTPSLSQVDYNKEFDLLISEWKSASNNFKSGNYTEDSMLSFSFYDMSDSSSAKAYYALYDIDDNGTVELILRKENNYEDIIAYIFTIKDDKAINIFGNDGQRGLREVPWSRTGSSYILNNGLIDSLGGNYAIYRMTDDGYSVAKIASSEPYDYSDMANLAVAKWVYYANKEQVDYDIYVQYLNDQGYMLEGSNILAIIDWVDLD
jgi:hypothetical protein